MKKRYLLISIITLSITSATSASALSLAHPGKSLHFNNCFACHIRPHDEPFYTRPDRRSQSMEMLKARAKGCNANFRLGLSDDEIDIITDYLNRTYKLF